MVRLLFLLCLPVFLSSQTQKGFIDFNWKDSTGELLLEVPTAFVGEPFLYVNSLAAGIGSNDIGLDRGQLGNERVVRFYKSGKTMLLIQDNLKYRAITENAAEAASVDEAFAESVIFGFVILDTKGEVYELNATPFLIRDAHGVIETLKENGEGNYSLDKSKSVVYPEGLLNFPDNTELEALLTFAGKPEGSELSTVTPTPELVSVRQHHSFVRLPDNKYSPRAFHPSSGYFYTSYYDYAAPIGEDMERRFIMRHRLEKKNKTASVSEAVEPIIYYIDPGCPEPVRSALVEGGKWWAQAFEYAGYKNAFQVKELPDGAHPLDVRYNMIQWVHRSTRGWSYGASVSDPRTGEIIKGHVSLGSLRVRQDYLIAQGIISRFDEGTDDPRMLQMALARLRQLSAHEIGHTIGLAHNFAASYNDRASVMDYPHPYIILEGDKLNFESAYDQKIGDWDKRSILYGYGQPDEGQSEDEFLNSVIAENKEEGFLFITDKDARPSGGLHPYAHLWDNGNDPVGELERISILRKHVLDNMGANSIKDGTPYSEIEKVLVPAYLMHRYQVDAASKLIGGYHFEYSEKPKPVNFRPVPKAEQEKALQALLQTVSVDFLEFPDKLLQAIPPTSYGYPRTRETFRGTTGSLFDPISAAEASAVYSLGFLLNPQRLSRLNLGNDSIGLSDYLRRIRKHIQGQSGNKAYSLMLEKALFIQMLDLKMNSRIDKQVAAVVGAQLLEFFEDNLSIKKSKDRAAHVSYMAALLNESASSPETFAIPGLAKMPPGSPIGCH